MPPSRAYYNENDRKAATWLRELIAAGHIAPGDVDERSIEDVLPSELAGYNQCHFFAGIGGWSYALRLAGWPDDRQVWTGSCPCQPFSAAGKGKGFADERHLWPAWHWLVSQCRPDIIFGEQVANALAWFDLVSADLEGEDYAVGAAIVGAHSVGAPHIRQRLYWVADSQSSNRRLLLQPREPRQASLELVRSGDARKLGNPGESRSGRDTGEVPRAQGSAERSVRSQSNEPWAASYVDCRDGKRRPAEPGTFPLAHGVPGRVGLLRGYGNAIVPQVAAAFIAASM